MVYEIWFISNLPWIQHFLFLWNWDANLLNSKSRWKDHYLISCRLQSTELFFCKSKRDFCKEWTRSSQLTSKRVDEFISHLNCSDNQKVICFINLSHLHGSHKFEFGHQTAKKREEIDWFWVRVVLLVVFLVRQEKGDERKKVKFSIEITHKKSIKIDMLPFLISFGEMYIKRDIFLLNTINYFSYPSENLGLEDDARGGWGSCNILIFFISLKGMR